MGWLLNTQPGLSGRAIVVMSTRLEAGGWRLDQQPVQHPASSF